MSDRTYLSSLPQKRMGAGCLFWDKAGRILLVKPVYKPGWEIPGGVVEQDESPLACCQREIREELGLDWANEGWPNGRLLLIDYNSPTERKTESLMFIFAGGLLSPADIARIQLPPDELAAFDFFTPNELPEAMTASLRRRVLAAWHQIQADGAVYLEDQEVIAAVPGTN
ncbi:MAG: NUDIX hydrolase [Chloroflexota bacterium]